MTTSSFQVLSFRCKNLLHRSPCTSYSQNHTKNNKGSIFNPPKHTHFIFMHHQVKQSRQHKP
ncbi:hypothetical protein Hanom_Chr16g01518881 [Helianthus anomalus]